MCDNARECAAARRQGFDGPPVVAAGAKSAGDDEPRTAGVHPPRSLVDKLGVRQGMRVVAAEGVDPAVVALVRAAGAQVEPVATPRSHAGQPIVQAAFLQVGDRAGLAAVASLRDRLATDGMLWVLWPKGVHEVGQGDVQRAGLDAGLVDVKVASVSETLSGLKFVFRLRDR
jgi:hypothetical protein